MRWLLPIAILAIALGSFGATKKEEAPEMRFGFSSGGQAQLPLTDYPVPVQIMKVLRSRGIEPAAAAGITGNALQESSWNPASTGMGGGGLWGFTASPVSLRDLKNFARQRGATWTSVRLQSIFLLQNLTIHDPYFRQKLNSLTDPKEAAEIFCWEWERPYAPTANVERRQQGALIALRMFRDAHQ